jgi:hypothetical protein
MTNNYNGVTKLLPLEANLVPCFPNCLANSYNTDSKELFPIGNRLITPFLALLERRGGIISTQTGGDCCPDYFSNRTSEKKMGYSFRLLIEITGWISTLISFDHIILC